MSRSYRKFSPEEHKEFLIQKIKDAVASGITGNDALEVLTEREYDKLVDWDVNIEALIYSTDQLQDIKDERRKSVSRPRFPTGYNKKYPQYKQDLYNSLIEFLQDNIGAEIIPKDKQNFRDIDFMLDDRLFRIVLSMPKKKIVEAQE